MCDLNTPADRQEASAGAMTAMATLGLLLYSHGHVSKKQFLDVSRSAMASRMEAGDTAGVRFLAAICGRLDSD